ncbi:MAG: DUF2851 family protein [Chloroflexi bacterium]|nr:DUF2851 family protein [Chloroflexota bacterium]
MSENLTERHVVAIWRRLSLSGAELTSEEGEPLRIIYPGKPGDEPGADFQNAVISTSRGLVKGDIEVHVRSSHWRAHRHHRDPAYDRVILHVVMEHDAGAAATAASGRSIPTIALHRYIGPGRLSQPASAGLPCLKAARRLTAEDVGRCLDSAGEERWLAKAVAFGDDLGRTGPGQCLYQGVMKALGYSRNEHAFLELARRAPLRLLESVAAPSDEDCLARQQALLLGAAGLLPSQRCGQRHQPGDEWADELEGLWAESRLPGAMPPGSWHLFRVRPANFPVRRIAAVSHLLLRYRERGIFDGLMAAVVGTAAGEGPRRLEESLLVVTGGYWASHFDFGLQAETSGRGPGGHLKCGALIGQGRAAEMVVNIVLPFALAWGKLARPELAETALALYRRYPRLAANSVERHMNDQLGTGDVVNSARRQQGLLHIYYTRCIQGRCQGCPLEERRCPARPIGEAL